MAVIDKIIVTDGSGDYTDWNAWEADITNTTYASAGTTARGLGRDVAGFVEASPVTINWAATNVTAVIASVDSTHEHNGTPGTGVNVKHTDNFSVFITNKANIKVELIEVKATGTSASALPIGIGTASLLSGMVVSRNLVYGFRCRNGFNAAYGIRYSHSSVNVDVFRNFVFDIDQPNASPTVGAVGIQVDGGSSDTGDAYNNSVQDISQSNGTVGVGMDAGGDLQNNCVTDVAGNCFAGTPNLEDHNLSSDATAAGTGSLINKDAVDQYISTATPDLHLKSGADCINAGIDLGTTPTGVNIDMDGFDLDADTSRDPWDIGGHEFEPVGVFQNTDQAMTGGLEPMSGGLQ